MAAVLAWLSRLWGSLQEAINQLGYLRQALGLVRSIQGRPTPYDEWFDTYTDAQATFGLASDLTIGFLHAYTQARADTAAILAAIAAITPTPPAPPPTSGQNASAVWDYIQAGARFSAWTHQAWAGSLSRNLDNLVAFNQAFNPAFTVEGSFWDESVDPLIDHTPYPDWTDIRQSDTRLTWLQRTDTANTWTADPNDGSPVAFGDPAHSRWRMRPAFSAAQFQEWKNAQRLAGQQAPTWPGLANVTLGTPVALGPDVTVAGPLDGILITITTPPAGLGQFTIGTLASYYRLGYVSFVDDDGQAESSQALAWNQAVYCPRAMVQAASALVKAKGGALGLITPWTVT